MSIISIFAALMQVGYLESTVESTRKSGVEVGVVQHRMPCQHCWKEAAGSAGVLLRASLWCSCIPAGMFQQAWVPLPCVQAWSLRVQDKQQELPFEAFVQRFGEEIPFHRIVYFKHVTEGKVW